MFATIVILWRISDHLYVLTQILKDLQPSLLAIQEVLREGFSKEIEENKRRNREQWDALQEEIRKANDPRPK